MNNLDFEALKNGTHTFIIAELSANHNGQLSVALETIKAAKRAGADAIKLQTFKPETITLDVDSPYFYANPSGPWAGTRLFDLYKKAYTPWEWHQPLFEAAVAEGLVCFSSPFDKTAVDLLESLDAPAYKIASFEITDIPLIKYAAEKGKPMIISTGIATEADIELAIATCRSVGNDQIAILKCTSQYPAPPKDANLINIPYISKKFNVMSGLSDHTLGIEAPVVAVSLGAKIIEKHFILDQSIGGPDAAFSLDETAFTNMVSAVRKTELMIGQSGFELTDKIRQSRNNARSLFVSQDINEGEKIAAHNIKSVRPGQGLHPKFYESVLGKTAKKNLAKGTPLQMEDLQ